MTLVGNSKAPSQSYSPRITEAVSAFLGYENNAKRSQVVMQYDEENVNSEVKANFIF